MTLSKIIQNLVACCFIIELIIIFSDFLKKVLRLRHLRLEFIISNIRFFWLLIQFPDHIINNSLFVRNNILYTSD